MRTLIEKYRHVIVGAFFCGFFILGMLIFKDFGAHYDEQRNLDFGERWTKYVHDVLNTGSLTQPLPRDQTLMDLTHGPILEISLTLLKNSLHLTDSRDILLLRHLSIFLLFFLGTVVFYFLCLRHFKNWKLALLGAAFLILSPRQLNHAFYNTMDIGFLVFFTLAMFSLIWFLDKKTWGRACLHALICAWAADIRIIGGLILVFTAVSMLMERPHENKQLQLNYLKLFLFYLFSFILFFVLFCPYLWVNPCSQTLLAILCTGLDRIPLKVFYFGKVAYVNSLPWHYVPVWILVSTPIMYIIFFFMGSFAAAKTFFTKDPGDLKTKRNLILFLLWFFIPLIISKGKIYDSWRHLFFIYPALILVAINGFQYLWESPKNKWPGKAAIYVRSALALLVLGQLISVAAFMVRNHPFEDIYFNSLAGKNLNMAKADFELNYWGNSDKQALEYILKTDPSSLIPVEFNFEDPGVNNLNFLPRAERERFVNTDDWTKAKYFIAQNRYPRIFPFKHEYYSIRVDKVKILTVFRLK
jgi:hypothetical protein